MSNIKVQCIDQAIGFLNTPVITSGDVNYDTITFDFCSKWDGFAKTAIFYRTKDEVYYQILDESDSCLIPREVLTEKGTIYIGVFGSKDDVTITSAVLAYKIQEGAITENTKPSDPTPDIYDQLIAKYAEYNSKLDSQIERMNTLEKRMDTGVGDAEKLGGQLPNYYATAQSVADLESGTTPAGDSKKLNGKNAIEYALSNYSFTDYLDYGTNYFNKSTDLNDWNKSGAYGVSSSCTNVPPKVTAWGTLLVVASSASKIIQIFKPWNYNGLYWRFGSNGTWGNWEKFNENATFLNFTHQNEINFKGNAEQTRQWFNYRNADTDTVDSTNLITEYRFGNKNGSTTGVALIADYFSGSAKKLGDYSADDFKKASYQIYEGDILAITKDGTYCCSKYNCTNFPPQITSSWIYVTKVGFRDSGYRKFFATPLNSNTFENLNNIYVAHESVKDSNGNMIWKSITEGFLPITGGNVDALTIANNIALHTGNSSPVVPTNVDPGVGASVTYADGTVIFVYEEE